MIKLRRAINYKAKSGMLSLVMGISLIIVFITSTLILAAYYFRVGNINMDVEDTLRDNAYFGTQLLLADEMVNDQQMLVDLFGEGQDSVRIELQSWGVYGLGYSAAFKSHRQEQVCFLTGAIPDEPGRGALYLADENQALQLAGSTFINGDVYLPKAGVRVAYIRGKPYTRDKMVYGQVLQSAHQVSGPNIHVLTYLYSLLNDAPKAAHEIPIRDSVVYSFLNRDPLLLLEPNGVVLESTIRGKVIVRSLKKITVSSAADLEDVILVAPEIEIEQGFKGKVQAFATDTLRVQDEVQLLFPSVVGLLGNSNSFMEIGDDSLIEGGVFSVSYNTPGIIKMNQRATLFGQLYTSGVLEFYGNVYGSVMCQKFLVRLGMGTFENHLVDVLLDSKFIKDDGFTGTHLLRTTRKGIVKWMQ